jgi:dTDP-4-dehydrorhamnose reductase
LTILLIGKDGQVGWELAELLRPRVPLVCLGRSEADLGDIANLRRSVQSVTPSVIINAAAYTAVDHAESQQQLAMQINGVAPAVLAEEAKRSGALLVQYSTDYVFDGEKAQPYVEDDPPNPLNVYGRTKLEGERAIAAAGCRHLILRTSWVYAARRRNFVLAMLRLARERSSLRVVDDQVGAPTWARDIARATEDLLNRFDDLGPGGIYHLCAQGFTSWHGLASAIFQSSALKRLAIRMPHLEAISSDQYPTPARRPKNSRLDCTRLANAGVKLPNWRLSLERCLAELPSP